MKKVKLFSFALAALMLGACSSEDVIDNGGQTVLPGEKGYVSFAVNLPTTPGSRVTYEDGTPNEYEVNDATLLLFTGADEASSTCQGVYSLNVSAFMDSPENQITSTAQIVREITKPSDEGNIYALVVLNRNNVFEVNTANNTGTIKGESIVGKTFEYFYNTAMDLQTSDLNGMGFFMTNAPLYSKAGGAADPTGGVVTTLSVIDADKICSTEAEALATPATTVYVERALGKVTLTGSTDLSADHNVNIASYVINGWALDNTNNYTYLVRNVASASWWGYQTSTGYRFVEGNPVKSNVSLYRTHFGVDPNYGIDYSPANFTTVGGSTIASENLIAANGTTPAYCLENTFDVAHMTEQNTTRVIVAAKLNITGAESTTGDFYLLNNNTSIIYQKGGVENEVKRLWMNYFESIKGTYIKGGTFTKDNVTVTLSPDANGGYLTVATVVMSEPSGVTWQEGKDIDQLNAAAAAYVATINSNLKIAYYKGGVAYYPVLIKHFGTETPWSISDIASGISYPGADASQKWLGRYGVLRNTWYQLNVTGLRNIGSPNVPPVTETYDDPGEQYISVEINILPWAKRSQDVEL